MRTCTKCQEEKPITEYFKQTQSADGYKRICKLCVKKYARTNYSYQSPFPPAKTYQDYLKEAGMVDYYEKAMKYYL